MNNKIYIIDVTNRDGVQTAHLGLAKLEKTMINLYLNNMGIFQSEAGFPVTRHEINYLNANMKLVEKKVLYPIRISGWLRAVVSDVEEAFKNVPKLKHVNLSISTSQQMIMGKFQGKMGFKEVVESMVKAVKAAKSLGAETVGVNAEDASRTKIENLIEFSLAAKEAGADRIRYCDTLGYDTPFTIYENVYKLAEAVKIPIELHCHNDLGMAVACSIAGAKGAIDAGVDAYINTTINGMGERAGNADLISCILAIKYGAGMEKYKLDENINLKMAWKIAHYASYAFKVPIPINQVGVGKNAFAHSSGIHIDGALKDRRNYELYDFEELGRGEPEIVETGRMIILGEYSGIKGLINVYGKLEIEFKDDEEARKILELARYANVHKQKPVTEDELIFIAKYPEEAALLMTMTP
ncbi:MAG: homocitrate synthase [Candidatus Omnitrophica bacterium]|nr:homocitrate synthase [Candidatus Omnitrophota bacterium]MCM8808881.1 homocitrate synthase [Candidatus Omnitrophota bacterium]MCM8832787.1 homocitrate synthase [Candidatus Omnitrophota bacterium]